MNEKHLRINFTSDLHSNFDGFSILQEKKKIHVGGFARIKSLYEQDKEKHGEVLFLDGGDYSMGTLFQTIFQKEASELRLLGAMGVDVTTIGNHEFDYRTKGICSMFEAAVESGEPLPQIVFSNVDWDDMEESEDKESYEKCFQEANIQKYCVIEKNNTKLALFGIFGKSALHDSPTCKLKFKEPVQAAKEVVAEIQEKESVDLIICLSHSGTSKGRQSEDERLAKEVGDIDVILSGHSHTVLREPIVHGETSIVSCGCFGQYLGQFTLEQKDNGRWKVENYNLALVSEQIPEDKKIKEKIDGFRRCIDKEYLEQFGYEAERVLAYNPYHFATLEDLFSGHEGYNLSDFLTDAYARKCEKLGVPVDVTIVPSGIVRGTYLEGNVTVSDVFQSFSLGIGADGIPGYPLAFGYLSGEELKNICEVDASISDLKPEFKVYMSGIHLTYNPYRLPLNKVESAQFVKKNGDRVAIKNKKLYGVVTDLYTAQMLKYLGKLSKGLVVVKPKTKEGKEMENVEQGILLDNEGREVKAWISIAEYMQSFAKGEEGIPVIPDKYKFSQKRKLVNESREIKSLLKNPSPIFQRILRIFGGVISACVVIAVVFRRRKKSTQN